MPQEYLEKIVPGLSGIQELLLADCEFAFNLMLNAYHFASVGVLPITPIITHQAFADNIN